jgi:cytidine deaminase
MKDISNEKKNELALAADKAREKSICPYSGKSVGAALLCADGYIYTGANVESAAFSPTVCAERVALLRALHDGKREFLAIAISGGDMGKSVNSPFTPCGVCRQMLSEYCESEACVIVTTADGYDEYTLGELFPHSFGKESL